MTGKIKCCVSKIITRRDGSGAKLSKKKWVATNVYDRAWNPKYFFLFWFWFQISVLIFSDFVFDFKYRFLYFSISILITGFDFFRFCFRFRFLMVQTGIQNWYPISVSTPELLLYYYNGQGLKTTVRLSHACELSCVMCTHIIVSPQHILVSLAWVITNNLLICYIIFLN